MTYIKTKRSQIFRYWQDKVINAKGEVKTLDEVTGTEWQPVVWDVGEPCCWGCGRRVKNEDWAAAFKKHYEDNRDLDALWDDAKVMSHIERAHIIPAALGGSTDPSNLFLLCSECHSLSPDTKNYEAFIRWVWKRREDYDGGKMKPPVIFRRALEELESRGYEASKIMKALESNAEYLLSASGYEDAKRFTKEHMGLHASTAADSTLIIGMADYIEGLYLLC